MSLTRLVFLLFSFCSFSPVALFSISSVNSDESDQNAHFLPEYGRFMVEATPARPYGSYTTDLAQVEVNMRTRYAQDGDIYCGPRAGEHAR